jgi:hypothetical protein
MQAQPRTKHVLRTGDTAEDVDLIVQKMYVAEYYHNFRLRD